MIQVGSKVFIKDPHYIPFEHLKVKPYSIGVVMELRAKDMKALILGIHPHKEVYGYQSLKIDSLEETELPVATDMSKYKKIIKDQVQF